jgi:tRNA (uracil-5-)-methyltransferase TRM9
MALNAFETQYVADVYRDIATSFHATRYNGWPVVHSFLSQLPAYAMVLDNGCGNGKYLRFPRSDLHWTAHDICAELLEIAAESVFAPDFLRANSLKLPYRDHQFDAVISIAVLHHLSTPERRAQCLKEMHRVLRPGGSLLLMVWAAEQQHARRKNHWVVQENHDAFIPWNHKHPRYYHLFTQSEIQALCSGPNWTLEDLQYDHDNWAVRLSAFKRV